MEEKKYQDSLTTGLILRPRDSAVEIGEPSLVHYLDFVENNRAWSVWRSAAQKRLELSP